MIQKGHMDISIDFGRNESTEGWAERIRHSLEGIRFIRDIRTDIGTPNILVIGFDILHFFRNNDNRLTEDSVKEALYARFRNDRLSWIDLDGGYGIGYGLTLEDMQGGKDTIGETLEKAKRYDAIKATLDNSTPLADGKEMCSAIRNITGQEMEDMEK